MSLNSCMDEVIFTRASSSRPEGKKTSCGVSRSPSGLSLSHTSLSRLQSTLPRLARPSSIAPSSLLSWVVMHVLESSQKTTNQDCARSEAEDVHLWRLPAHRSTCKDSLECGGGC